MNTPDGRRSEPDAGTGLVRGMATIVVAGIVLGLAFNAIGPTSRRLPWFGAGRLATLESLEEVLPAEEPSAAPGGYNQITDPMAIGLGSGLLELPEVPVLDRPIQIQMRAVKQFFDADAAVIIDARDIEEFADGHIAGALSMPFDVVSSEPERLESLNAGGQPIIVYCGGGACEVSLSLAWDLLAAGQERVVVYVGGFSEWAEAGHPVERGRPGVARGS